MATIAEGNLYLNNIEEAINYYRKASKKANLREKLSVYNQAFTAYSAMHGEKPNDQFIHFLKESFLT